MFRGNYLPVLTSRHQPPVFLTIIYLARETPDPVFPLDPDDQAHLYDIIL